jgi:RNA polymerase sigma factor (sigma-70 family)
MFEISREHARNYDFMLNIVFKFNSYNYNQCDLITLGIDGLLKTIDNFNPEIGDFKNFAVKRINGELLNGIKKISNERKKIINIDDAAAFLETNPELNPLNLLILQERNAILRQYLLQLQTVEREVLMLNFFEDLNLTEISKKLKLTVRRISQIKQSALLKLKNKLITTGYFSHLTKKNKQNYGNAIAS